MITVKIKCSNPYEVHIGSESLGSLGVLVREICGGQRAVIITDETVWQLYGQQCSQTLLDSNFEVFSQVSPPGESSKSLERYGEILEALAQEKVTRGDVIVALGGGVVGDMAGFVAATYLRGIAFVQVPTTLLAAVDSSVGGKTAINLSSGKNLAGAFYQPGLVLCDCDLLATLTEKIFRDGCAEVIKYGVILDRDFYEQLRTPISTQIEEVITACVWMKESTVSQDEYDRGLRQLLNFGHTFGHALEARSGYALSHGEAVATGMALMARMSWQQGWCRKSDYEDLVNLLESYGFSLAIPYGYQELYDILLADKKRNNDNITLVVMEELGRCRLQSVPLETCRQMLKQALRDLK